MQELSLSELNQQIKTTLEGHLAPSYWVVAEIAQLQVNHSGHCYLELVQKEEGKVIAKARATIWAYTFRNISAWFTRTTGGQLAAGMRILANTKVSFHEVYGLSLNIKDIDPSYTLGERERARQQVIQQLTSDGVMDMNKSLELPVVPQNVAIISSATAAGYQDFINQLTHNPYGYHINYQLFAATMQGNSAPDSIIHALHQVHASKKFQLVVLIRGGGSQLDLDCFDNYELCSHLAQFPLPVLTGIGHERDTSIADRVAHTQLKTPTAVAEFILYGFNAFHNKITDLFTSISNIASNYITAEKELIKQLMNDIVLLSHHKISKENTAINTKAQQIVHLVKWNQTRAYNQLTNIEQQIAHTGQLQLNKAHNQLKSLTQKIDLLNPKHLLKRGYALAYKNGKLLRGTRATKGDQIEVITETQQLSTTVTQAKENNHL